MASPNANSKMYTLSGGLVRDNLQILVHVLDTISPPVFFAVSDLNPASWSFGLRRSHCSCVMLSNRWRKPRHAGRTGGGWIRCGTQTIGTVRRTRGIDSFLFLPSIAKPNANHFLFHAQSVGQRAYLFAGWLRVKNESLFQGPADRRLNWGPFLATSSDRLRCGQRITEGSVAKHAGNITTSLPNKVFEIYSQNIVDAVLKY